MEDAKEQQIALPLQLLTQLVRASDKATHDFLSWYLDTTLDLYQKAQKTVSTRLSEAKNVVSSPRDFMRNFLAGQSSPPAPAPDGGEVEKLRRQIEELQQRLAHRDQGCAPRT